MALREDAKVGRASIPPPAKEIQLFLNGRERRRPNQIPPPAVSGPEKLH
jgi:hypothetical protein